ncbi:MAG: SIS domain-containing protein [Pleomorphochaeta sp.]
MIKENIQVYKDNIFNEIINSIDNIDIDSYIILVEAIKKKKRIFLSASGRCRLIMEAFCMRLNHLGINSFVVGNIPCPSSNEGDLLISLSGSGTTETIVNIENRALELDLETIIITTNKNMEYKKNRHIININAPSRISDINNNLSFQLMGSLFEQSSFILLEIVIAILSEGISREFIINNHENLE